MLESQILDEALAKKNKEVDRLSDQIEEIKKLLKEKNEAYNKMMIEEWVERTKLDCERKVEERKLEEEIRDKHNAAVEQVYLFNFNKQQPFTQTFTRETLHLALLSAGFEQVWFEPERRTYSLDELADRLAQSDELRSLLAQ